MIDVGPGAGDEGGWVVAAGPPGEVAKAAKSRTAPYLTKALGWGANGQNELTTFPYWDGKQERVYACST